MAALDNNTKWQVAYWTRMSYQRNPHLSPQYQPLNGEGISSNIDAVKNYDNQNGNSNHRMSFAEDHQEFLNPLTKDWRESLRTWKQSYNRHYPRESNKQWMAREKRNESKKVEIVETISKY